MTYIKSSQYRGTVGLWLSVPLLLTGVLTAFLSVYSFWTDDAVGYRFFCVPPGSPPSYDYITSVGMIFESQANHYMEHGGRFFVHFLVQLFCALLGKGWFAAVNALIWIAIPPALLLLAGRRVDDIRGMWVATLLTWLCFFTFPWQPPVQINYVWVGLMCLLWCRIFMTDRLRNPLAVVIAAIFSALAGSGNESFSIPMCAALVAWLTAGRLRMSRRQWIYALMFAAGAIVTVAAPGNFRRMEHSNTGWSLLHTVENSLDSMLLPLVFAVAVIIHRKRVRQLAKSFRSGAISDNTWGKSVIFAAAAVIVNLLMSAALGFNSGVRMTSCASLGLSVLILAMPTHAATENPSRKRRATIAVALVGLLTIAGFALTRYSQITLHNEKYETISRLYHESETGCIILPDSLYAYDSRDARLMRMPWVQTERHINPARPDLRMLPASIRRLPLDRDTNLAMEFIPGAWIMVQSIRRPSRFIISKTLLPGILDRAAGEREADFSSQSDIFADSTDRHRVAVYVNTRPYLRSEVKIEP